MSVTRPLTSQVTSPVVSRVTDGRRRQVGIAGYITLNGERGPILVKRGFSAVFAFVRTSILGEIVGDNDLFVDDTLNFEWVESMGSFQWDKDGEPIIGATAASYTKEDVVTADAGIYGVTVEIEGKSKRFTRELSLTDPAYRILVKTDSDGTSTDTQFTLPATGTYTVDWGDGTVEEKTDAATHTYGSAGNYVIKVTGGLTRIRFNNGGDRLKLLEVQNWGDATWSSFNAAYWGCANCLFNAKDALVLPNDCLRAFLACDAFNQSVANFNTAAVTTMANMFRNCTAFNQSVANFDTAAVENMQSMFSGCTAFKQPVATFSLAGLDATGSLDFFATATNINVGTTTTNYDATLIAWAAQLPLAHGFAQSPNFGTAKYSAGAAADAKAALVAAGWSFTDGGEEV